jgi:hypothetical protein
MCCTPPKESIRKYRGYSSEHCNEAGRGKGVLTTGMNLSLVEIKVLTMFGKRVQPASTTLAKKARKLGFPS